MLDHQKPQKTTGMTKIMGIQGANHESPANIGCVIAQAFFCRGASAIFLKSRIFSVELHVI